MSGVTVLIDETQMATINQLSAKVDRLIDIMNINQSKLIPIKEFSELYGITSRTLYNWEDNGRDILVRKGKRVFVDILKFEVINDKKRIHRKKTAKQA